MASSMGVYSQIIADGMATYWRAVYSKTDEGLDATELKWKRDHERDMARMEEKLGHAYADFFEKNR
jgi:hypothetical protein